MGVSSNQDSIRSSKETASNVPGAQNVGETFGRARRRNARIGRSISTKMSHWLLERILLKTL
jgi:hypothetical protein